MGVGGFFVFFLRCETLGQVPSAPRSRSGSQRGDARRNIPKLSWKPLFPTRQRRGRGPCSYLGRAFLQRDLPVQRP